MNSSTEVQDIKIESDYSIGDLVKKGTDYSWNDLFDILDDLYGDYVSLQEEFEDFKQDVEDNYRTIPVSEQIGITDNDFI